MCCGGWVRNARVRQLCSKALRMRSACYAIFCLARAAADGSLLRLTPGQSQHSAQFTYDVRPRSRRDRPSLIHGGAASLDRAPGCRQDFRSSLNSSTATSMSDIAVSSGASVVSTSSGTTVTAATTAVHGSIGGYSCPQIRQACQVVECWVSMPTD